MVHMNGKTKGFPAGHCPEHALPSPAWVDSEKTNGENLEVKQIIL